MSNILFTPKQLISKEDKALLKNEGYIVIEVNDISKIKTITDLTTIGSDEVAITALEVLLPWTNASGGIHGEFAKAILNKAINKVKASTSKAKQ